MDKEQLREIVDRIHANWNITPLPNQLPTIYRAWWELLEPFDQQLINNIITQLAKEDNWAPRPGTVYKRAIDTLNPNPSPTPPEAWDTYRALAHKIDMGIWEEDQNIHPTLAATIQSIGGYHLHTNSDREHFTQIYTQHKNKEYQ